MSNENQGSRLMEGIERIPERSADVRDQAQSIESQLDEIEKTYENTRKRAEQGLPEEVGWRGLDNQSVERDSIQVDHNLSNLETDMFHVSDEDSIEIEAETREQYVRELVSKHQKKQDVKEDFEGRIEAVRNLSGEAFQDFLQSTSNLEEYNSPSDALDGSWGENLEKKLSMAEGKRESQRVIEDIINRAEAEQHALENEMKDVAESYTREIYDQALATAKRLGGEGRPYTGELDLLEQISDTRADVISNQLDEYDHNSDDVGRQEGALKAGKEAMESQAQLIAQYAMNLDEARQDASGVVAEASEILEGDDLTSARERISAMEEGYAGFGNSMGDECYDSLSEAVEAVMREGMMEDEEFDSGYSVSFNKIPYLGAETETTM